MQIITTEDIPEAVSQNLESECVKIFTFKDRHKIFLRSAEPPSWIQIFGSALEWITPLKVMAAVFLSQIAKNAADDLWKNKRKIARLLKETSFVSLLRLSKALVKVRRQSPRIPDIRIGMPIPNDHFGTVLVMPADSIEEAAVALALFVVHAEKIEKVIKSEIEAGNGPAGQIRILLKPDGSFILKWKRADTFEPIEHELDKDFYL